MDTNLAPAHHIAYAKELLRRGFFEGWFCQPTVQNVLESVYTDD